MLACEIVSCFPSNCMSFYSDEDEHLGVENLVSVVQDMLIVNSDDE